MADIRPPEISTVTAAPIRDSSLGEGGSVTEDDKGREGEGERADVLRLPYTLSAADGGVINPVPSPAVPASNACSTEHEGPQEIQATARLQPSPQPSFGAHTTTEQLQSQHPVAPPRRFTSVNINKQFLEKTPSTSGTSSGGGPLAGHIPGGVGGSGQRRKSPASARSPSTDRPAPSRLVTAKLTAVQQPSAASTPGWLRTNSSTPGTSTTTTPPSSSPQPIANGPTPSHAQSVSSTGSHQTKRRAVELPSQNGTLASSQSPQNQQASSRPVWGRVSQSLSNAHNRDAEKQLNDFPTAAEAVHGRKAKGLAAETAAAQKQAMNETAAAFRGVHLDPNAHHWDEMEDEDSDFLAGVIEFGDGTQYKIESTVESVPPQDPSSSAPTQGGMFPRSDSPPVSKEERFGEDFDRSWPLTKTSPVQQKGSGSPPPQTMPLQRASSHHSPTDGPMSALTQSPYDGTSPTSRVLFNERLNRLEPWSSTKPRSSRDSRGDNVSFGLSRQHAANRDAQPHSYPSSSNVQLLQKGGVDSTWKGGPPRGFNHVPPERGRWGAPSSRDEDRQWEMRRHGSIGSSDTAGTSVRELSRDREAARGRWDSENSNALDRERRSSNANMPLLPQSLAHDRSRDAGRQLPPHLSRMPPPPVPPARGREMPPDARAPHPPPPVESPPASVNSLLSPTSERAPPSSGAEELIDKDSLVKDAMQLAIERAKRRKQEGEEEEKRRSEAAERARKKAEALAVVQEKKKLPSAQEDEKVSEEAPRAPLPKMNGIEFAERSPETVDSSKKAQTGDSFPRGLFNRPLPTHPVNLPPSLPRRPSIPPTVAELTAASQADSWRSKAAPVPSSPPRPQSFASPQSSRSVFLPAARDLELDLSLQPDENIEVVDFSDLGKLLGNTSSPTPPPIVPEATPSSVPTRTRRPVAGDLFDDQRSLERVSPVKSELSSWRRPPLKPAVASPPQSSGEELRTQTMPIFSTDEPVPARESVSAAEAKVVQTPSSSPQSNRHALQSEQTLASATTQSVYVPSATLALRSPRTPSHFKEAPMSTLTDTMSRIKGALDGMQSQDSPLPGMPKEKEASEQRLQAVPPQTKTKMTETSSTLWREPRRDISPQVSRILTLNTSRSPREIFDITRPDPPRSPKPAWKAFVVRLPNVSCPRDVISRRQLHFWNLPQPGVRWDILSWDPPVEGMNKRGLSRDEIFHRKYSIKGGKLRVQLPTKRLVPHVLSDKLQQSLDASSQSIVVTTAGVKIKLPSNVPFKEKIVVSSRIAPPDRFRESNVPSWRKSAMPSTRAKKDRQNTASSSRIPSEHGLNTTSRSPPPEPLTPFPQVSPHRNGITSSPSPASVQSATVSLPTNSPSHSRAPGPRRPSGTDVAFFRTSRGEPGAGSGKPLPRFTVTSELDRSYEAADLLTTDHAAVSDKAVEPAQPTSLRSSPRNVLMAETSLVSSNTEGQNADEFTAVTKPVTPPSTHTSSAWGKSPLSFSLKESPARSAPDPEHLKAVWSQPSGRTTATTSNSLKGIADDLPSIPFTVQDMKSEDGETPPPTAPVPPPSRLSLQEVTRAFQQVPGAPAPVTSPSSRPPSFASVPLLPSAAQQSYRSNQVMAMPLPPQHTVRPAFAAYSQSLVGHSPSPTLMYAPGISSPVAHPRMSVNGSSPPVAHPIWLPTPPPQSTQAAAFMRAGPPPPAPMMYPSSAPPGPPGHMMHRRDPIVSPPSGMSLAPNMYQSHPMEMQGHMHQTSTHGQSPHHPHTHAMAHPIPHLHPMFSPPQHGQAPAMYAVPVGAGRGAMVPRPGYDGMQQVSHLAPHNVGFQAVPPASFSHPFHS